jgi:tripartite motif-containing protein 71
MKLKKSLSVILITLVAVTAAFMYLYLTGNRLLWQLPLVPDSLTAPRHLFSFGAIPGREQLKRPMAIVFDGEGNLHVSDFDSGAVRVFSADGVYLFSFGTGSQGEGRLKSPYGLAFYNGNIYVADNQGRSILIYSQQGEFLRNMHIGDGQGVDVFIPTALAVNPDNGNLYIADVFGHRVLVTDQQGELLFAVGTGGGAKGELSYPNGVALDSKKNIYISDSNNARIQVFSPDGKEVLSVIGKDLGDEKLSVPRGLVVDGRGDLWVVDVLTHSVNVFKGSKAVMSFGGLGDKEGSLYFPNDLILDENENIYVVERGMGRISVFGQAGFGR